MSSSFGIRYQSNLFDCLKKQNITKLTEVRRFGEPLVSAIKQLIP